MNSFIKRALTCTFITTVALFSYSNIQPANANYLLFDEVEMQALKQHGSFSLLHEDAKMYIRAADKALSQPNVSVTQKKVLPPSGDAHDYVSLSTYAWPDTNKLDGLPYIILDGRVNPEKNDNDRFDAQRMDTMIQSIRNLSMAYYLTGQEKYAAKAVDLLHCWFIHSATRMNPNMQFAHRVPGSPGKATGKPAGIIETVNLIKLTDAIQLLEPSPSFSSTDRLALKQWYSEYLTWLLSSDFGIKESAMNNNHGVWYDAQVAVFANYIGRNDIASQVVEAAKEKRISRQIEPDGSMPKELARTKSMSYTAYNLEAFITLALVGDKVGVDLWNYQTADGRSIKKAIDYFGPYLAGEKHWDHAQILAYQDTRFARYLYFAKCHYSSEEYTRYIDKLF